MMAAGIIGLLGLAVTVASLAWLQLQPTKLSALRDPVSQYGITGFRAGYRAATIAFGATQPAITSGLLPGSARSRQPQGIRGRPFRWP